MTLLTLVDPNLDVLDHCAERLADRDPTIEAADVLEPLPITERFDSIAINYVLHCLPGPAERKGRAIDHLVVLAEPDGVLFGATILGEPDRHTILSRPVLTATNRRGSSTTGPTPSAGSDRHWRTDSVRSTSTSPVRWRCSQLEAQSRDQRHRSDEGRSVGGSS